MSNTSSRGDFDHKLHQLERRVAALEEALIQNRSGLADVPRGQPLADLPSSLSKSLQAMQFLGEADASTVSQKTGRNRSVETIYLNQLARLGTLTRSRVGKKVFFKLAKVY